MPRLPLSRAAVAVVALTAAIATDLGLGLGGENVTDWVDNLGELIAALGGAIFLGLGARRSSGRLRASLIALAAGTGMWGAGQGVWTWYNQIDRIAVPFPSVADVGFLCFPVGAVIALLLFPAAPGGHQRRLRTALDGAVVACSLLLVSWITVLGAVWRSSSGGTLGVAVSLAYPASDVVLIALALLTMSRAGPRHANQLRWITFGLCCMAISDSSFAYLTTLNTYGAGDWLDTGWITAFLLLAVAGMRADSGSGAGSGSGSDRPAAAQPLTAEQEAPGWGRSILPYLPLPIAAVLIGSEINTGGATAGDLFIGAGLALLVICRQFVMIGENRSLLATVRSREEQLEHLAFHDALTGLANRSLFFDRVNHAVELQRRDLRSLGIFFLDLDGFKQVNDGLGHSAGDVLLRATADRLREALRSGDTIARFGGDEFAILLEDGLADPMATAWRVLACFDRPFQIDGRPYVVRTSIGLVTVSPEQRAPEAVELLRRADLAMYAAKRSGGATVKAYEPAMGLSLGDPALPAELRQALADGAIRVLYQQVRGIALPASADPVLVEALARWDHPARGPIPPQVFIALAEEFGLIDALGDHVLKTAVADAAAWSRRHPERPIAVSVNLSARQLGDPRLPDRVAELLREAQLPAGQLVLEITESCVLSDEPPVPEVLRRLHGLGIRLAVDDFGAGYSNLANLRRARLDVLKVDKALVDHLEENAEDRQFLGAVVSFAHELGLLVIAEGCEREGQLAVLRDLGCDLVQGFLHSRPVATFGPEERADTADATPQTVLDVPSS